MFVFALQIIVHTNFKNFPCSVFEFVIRISQPCRILVLQVCLLYKPLWSTNPLALESVTLRSQKQFGEKTTWICWCCREMSIRKQNASYLLLSSHQSLKIMRGNKAVVLDFFTEWFTFFPPSWFHFNLWWACFAFLQVKVKNNPEKPFISVTPAELRQKTSLEANSLSHPSSLISPAW